MSLPASARSRWGLDDGGTVGYLDLGDAVLVVAGGIDALRDDLLAAMSAAEWQAADDGFGDRELATQ